ncbi:MAG: hypothetical protein BWY78_00199 [Alphaproteobacteria bacterium ADurb.Bin438]|nr:MAG: hypothetical protein BWY78_00199 [Alphaproteobacteria bacterium ADurb.Bin438]
MKYFIKATSFIIISLCFIICSKVNAQENKEEDFTTSALVVLEKIENPDCTSENECETKMFQAIRKIPSLEFDDYNKENNSISLLISDKRITTEAVITGIINKSGVVKVKSIIMPIPYEAKPHKDPYEGKSEDEIKKAYDDYYKENPDLKPENW